MNIQEMSVQHEAKKMPPRDELIEFLRDRQIMFDRYSVRDVKKFVFDDIDIAKRGDIKGLLEVYATDDSEDAIDFMHRLEMEDLRSRIDDRKRSRLQKKE